MVKDSVKLELPWDVLVDGLDTIAIRDEAIKRVTAKIEEEVTRVLRSWGEAKVQFEIEQAIKARLDEWSHQAQARLTRQFEATAKAMVDDAIRSFVAGAARAAFTIKVGGQRLPVRVELDQGEYVAGGDMGGDAS